MFYVAIIISIEGEKAPKYVWEKLSISTFLWQPRIMLSVRR